MVSKLAIAAMLAQIIIAGFFPVCLGIYFYKKYQISLKAFLVGALIFFTSQVVLRMPMLNILGIQPWFSEWMQNPWFSALFLGATAGIFEEVGRWVGFKYLLKDRLEYKNGIAYGIGHGGVESIILLGMAGITNLTIALAINSGTFDTAIAAQLPVEVANQLKDAILGATPLALLGGGLERIFAITLQIAYSVFVLYGVKQNKKIYILYAILLHMVADSPLQLLSQKFGLVVTEAYIGILAVIGIWYIRRGKELFDNLKRA